MSGRKNTGPPRKGYQRRVREEREEEKEMAGVLVIGGDRVGAIENMLQDKGYHHVYHVSGRKKSDVKAMIPSDTKLILVFINFVSHNLCKNIKKLAKQKQVPIVFCRRSCEAISTCQPAMSIG